MQFQFGQATTVYAALHEITKRQPDRIAVVSNEISVSYRDLIARVDSMGARLRLMGVNKGDRVAVYAQNCPEFLYAYIAAAKIGAVFVPINLYLTVPEVEYILSHSDARVVFCNSSVPDISSISLPGLTIRSLDELSEGQIGDEPGADDVSESDDLIIVYTSGSTGAPKAVVLDQKAQMGAARSLIELWGLSPADVTVVGSPFGFLLGLSTSTLVTLLAGAQVVLLRRFHPGEVLDAIARYKVTIYNGVPTMFVMMLEFCEQHKPRIDLTSVRAFVCSGAPLRDELGIRFVKAFGKELQNYFGITEAYPLIGRPASHGAALPPGSIGVIAPGAEVKFVAPDGTECLPNVAGEMLAKGPSTMRSAELTAAAFRDGWFLTGDLGFRDRDGYLFITGRSKDLIIRGGNNIAPAEIEAAMMRHPDVADVAVIGVAAAKYGEVPIAFVVARSQTTVTPSQMLAFAAEHLANFKVPARVFIEDEMPIGKTGKVDKLSLKDRYSQRQNEAPERATEISATRGA